VVCEAEVVAIEEINLWHLSNATSARPGSEFNPEPTVFNILSKRETSANYQ